MEFPKEFFLDEVREGFYVPAMMKRAWAAELEILVEIDKICEKHKLHYYIDYGTLLGAIRHHGFIPWDDDIDIMMLRNDYEIFAEVAQAELPEELRFRSLRDENSNNEPVSSVQHRQMLISSPFLGKYHNYLYGAGVDIFPYDFASNEKEKEELRQALFKSLCILISSPSLQGENQAVLEHEARKVKKITGTDLFHSSNYKKTLLSLLASCFTQFTQNEEEIINLLDLFLYKDYKIARFKKEWYAGECLLDFEFLSLPAPKEYKRVISKKYKDYLSYKKGGGVHDYPVYRKMEAEYRKGIGEKLFYQYSIKKNDLKKRKDISAAPCNQDRTGIWKPRIFFLPSLHSRWDAMRGLFLEASKDDTVNCFVLPIPYFYKDGLGNCSPAQWDYSLFENELGTDSPLLLDFRSLNLQDVFPDVIFIDEPYDEYNLSFMVDPRFFSKHLKQCTKQLIYLPWFISSEIDWEDPEDGKAILNAENYVIMPAIVHSDYVILQSEGMVKLYQSLLEKECGKEYAEYWREKLLPLGSSLFDKTEKEENYGSHAIWERVRIVLKTDERF